MSKRHRKEEILRKIQTSLTAQTIQFGQMQMAMAAKSTANTLLRAHCPWQTLVATTKELRKCTAGKRATHARCIQILVWISSAFPVGTNNLANASPALIGLPSATKLTLPRTVLKLVESAVPQ
jgi:hypothetical protein